ncbi:MAG: glutamine amidotransferase family protein [Pseudomonadota bacterium]
MCGIVGLFLKDRRLEGELGGMLSDMLVTMTERGPDSAGIAVYTPEGERRKKVTLRSARPDEDFPALEAALRERPSTHGASIERKDTHGVLRFASNAEAPVRALLREAFPSISVMSAGSAIEIYKEVGAPASVSQRFGLGRMKGRHAIGHTRMATESAVTTMGAHPFSTGPDQCLVHNGSLSNHNRLRRKLEAGGHRFDTENDSEVAAAYLTGRMREGRNLGEALEDGLDELDGFFTFVVGTATGFGVLRDPIACKPAMMAETPQYVAFGSEYRALAVLPGITKARLWEPEPATVYFWEH